MFCCGRKKASKDTNVSPVLDVEKIVQDYVWDLFQERRSSIQRLCLPRERYNIDVPMSYFHFESIKQNISCKHDSQDPRSRPTKLTGKDVANNSNAVEISTDFINDTDREQIYKFRITKARTAILDVTYQKGYSFGGRAHFTVGIPEISPSGGVETTMSVDVTKQEGEHIEDTVTLENVSDIKVKAKAKYVAKVILTDARISYNFTVWCRMSLPAGFVPVAITKKNSTNPVFVYEIDRLDEVFDRYKDHVNITKEAANFPWDTYAIDFKNTGTVEGVRIVNQRIVLESSDLGYESSDLLLMLPFR